MGFQPQPGWGGHDYYRAHAGGADPYLFDHAWGRVQQYGGAPAGGMGVGIQEARHWHRRAYGYQNEVQYLAPEELGHAAAYEAYRTWIYNRSMHEPFGLDPERQREALTGLAVAEAARLLQYSARPADQYARLAASEAAAHTSSYIFYQSQEDDFRSRPRYRTGAMDDPYSRDDELLYPSMRGGRSRSAYGGRSLSRHRSYSQLDSAAGMGMPYSAPGYAGTAVSPVGYGVQQPSAYGGYAGSQSVPMVGAPYATQMPMSAGSAYGSPMSAGYEYGAPMGMGVSTSAYGQQMPGVAGSYSSGMGVPVGYGGRTRSSSFSYPGQQVAPYMGTSMSASGMPVASPTIVIHKHRKSKSKHRHRHSYDGNDDWDRHSSRY
jgi:hypothetical protein